MADQKDNKGAPKDAKPKGGGKDAGKKKGSAPAAPEVEDGPVEKGPPPRLRDRYREHVRARLAEVHGIKNPMAMPVLEKIVINVNMGRHLEGSKLPPEKKGTVLETLAKISGQKPVVTKAKKSVSNFKVRAGFETAAMVTLRRDRMWHFLDRLINLATPRIKDFRGLNRDAFDKQGNYAMGVTEQGVFPEINMAEVNFTHGMNINFCFGRSSPELSRFVLEELGMPFAKAS